MTSAYKAAAQPSDARLQVRAEVRDRVEGFAGAGFTSERDDVYNLARVRIDLTMRPSRLVTINLQTQDARPFGKTIGPTGAPFKDVVNLHQAYVDVGDAAHNSMRVRAGRQELAFGEERLVGAANWLNAGRAFDGARVTMRRSRYQLDAFGASVVTIRDRVFGDSSGHGNRFFGVYASTGAAAPKSTIQPYLLWRLDRNVTTELGSPGDLSEGTVGARWSGALPARLDYGTEMAWQFGSIGSDSVRAWAGHWQVRHTLSTPLVVRITSEYNYASGDHDPTDGRRGTFDQLYATGHDKYGLADQVGWRNIRHARTGIEFAPVKPLTLSSSYHSWWLADAHDGLYNAAGALVARVAHGATDRHVGQEVDAQAVYSASPQVRITGGYAHVFPGAFLREATPGSSYSFPYIAVTYTYASSPMR